MGESRVAYAIVTTISRSYAPESQLKCQLKKFLRASLEWLLFSWFSLQALLF